MVIKDDMPDWLGPIKSQASPIAKACNSWIFQPVYNEASTSEHESVVQTVGV